MLLLKVLLLTSYIIVAVFAKTLTKEVISAHGHANLLRRGGNKIIGGEEATPHEFPWLVDIRRHNEHFCGGSILNSNWIITSAQCIKGVANDFVVVAGDHDISTYGGTEQRRSVQRAVVHPNYNQFTFENDVALIELAVPLEFNEFVRAVILQDVQAQGEAIVAGWGALEEGAPLETKLQRVNIPLVSNAECQSAFDPIGVQITPSMICAGQDGRDSCQGDAGGPLICKNGDDLELCGIVSWGIGCDRGYPGVYTRTPFYDSFISETISGILKN